MIVLIESVTRRGEGRERRASFTFIFEKNGGVGLSYISSGTSGKYQTYPVVHVESPIKKPSVC